MFKKNFLIIFCSTIILTACGGGGSNNANNNPVSLSSTDIINVSPTYHLSPVMPDEPTSDSNYSTSPNQIIINKRISERKEIFDPELLKSQNSNKYQYVTTIANSNTTTVSYYNPSQIKTLYGLSSLSNTLSNQGAGQIIAIIDAYNDPNIASDLNTFSTKFNLPSCKNITTTQALINSKKLIGFTNSNSCNFQVVYANANSATAKITPPITDNGWATEITLDVEWAHAIAPLASIVLIEANDSSTTSLANAISIANTIGSSVVSMSFGAPEGNWMLPYDNSLFNQSGVTYFASSGDSGHGVNWPAVSPKVLGVGGTVLNSSTTPRNESAWNGSGGGVSAYEVIPSYQTSLTKSISTKYRSVPDISYNSSSNSSYLIYMTTGNSGAWYGVYGTSAASPQWAALFSIINANRVASNKLVSNSNSTSNSLNWLYSLGSSTSYSTDLYDITNGNDGSCSICLASKGFDAVTGLGTPNMNQLIPYLTKQ